MFRTFNPDDFSLILGGIPAVGFAPDTFITFERAEDSANESSGAKGDVTRVTTKNRIGTCVVRLVQGSPTNAYLNQQLADMENNGGGVFSLLGKDAGSGDRAVGEQCWVRKHPTMEFGTETQNREWTIVIANLQMFVLGQTA